MGRSVKYIRFYTGEEDASKGLRVYMSTLRKYAMEIYTIFDTELMVIGCRHCSSDGLKHVLRRFIPGAHTGWVTWVS